MSQARGNGRVELLDAAAVDAALPPAALGERAAALRAAVAYNGRQHATHALAHALRGLRDVSLLLGRACGEEDYSLPRLRAAVGALALLPALPPGAAAALAPPLCEAAAACLAGLGPAPLLPPPEHLRLLTLCRAALAGAGGAETPGGAARVAECRCEVYTVLLSLLRLGLPPAAAAGAWAHPQQPVLRAQAAAALRSPPGAQALVETVALDARDGIPVLRGAALALLGAMLDFEADAPRDWERAPPPPPLVAACLCRSPYLSELLAPLSTSSSPLNAALCALVAPPPPPDAPETAQARLWELWRFQAALGLVTRLLLRLREADADDLFGSLAATGALAHLPRARFLSLPLAYLADADEAMLAGGGYGGGYGGAEAARAAAAHGRVLTPLLRAVSAALLAGGPEGARRHAAAVAAETLGIDEARASGFARLLRAPLRFAPRSGARLAALRTARLVGGLLAHLAAAHPEALARAHGAAFLAAALRLVGPLAAALADAADADAAGGAATSLVVASGFSMDDEDDDMGVGAAGAAAAEAAATEELLAALLAFVHGAARPPLSATLPFGPALREGGALSGGAPPLSALRRVLDACAARLSAADARHAALAELAAALPAATAQQLRQTFGSLAAELGGGAGVGAPPDHFDQPQLARCTDALAAAGMARATGRAKLHLGCLEQALLLLHQHLASWAGGGIPPAELRELRAGARRGGGGAAPPLTAALSALLRLAPSRAFAQHEEQLVLVCALARKSLELLG